MASLSATLPRARATGATATAGFLATAIAAALAKAGRPSSPGTASASSQDSSRPGQRCQ